MYRVLVTRTIREAFLAQGVVPPRLGAIHLFVRSQFDAASVAADQPCSPLQASNIIVAAFAQFK